MLTRSGYPEMFTATFRCVISGPPADRTLWPNATSPFTKCQPGEATGYCRRDAARLLQGHDRSVRLKGRTVFEANVASGWTELAAVRNKARVWVFEALKGIRRRLPFPLLGLDSDHGGEFINGHLCKWCREEGITFTRSRPQRRNENCFGERKKPLPWRTRQTGVGRNT